MFVVSEELVADWKGLKRTIRILGSHGIVVEDVKKFPNKAQYVFLGTCSDFDAIPEGALALSYAVVIEDEVIVERVPPIDIEDAEPVPSELLHV